jgi:NADH dehydrogenase
LAEYVSCFPYDFAQPQKLTESLRGADTLYNTYWVRFPHGDLDYDVAVRNLGVLIDSAARAGIRKIVHMSIINPAEDSPYAYFRGKAKVERAIRESGLRYTILRPTVIFGPEDILINNISWMLRKFPVFLMPGTGDYLIQPIYVEDLADLAVRSGGDSQTTTLDAVGPETFTYRDLVSLIARTIGTQTRIAGAPVPVVYALGAMMGWFLHDVVLTYEEVAALAHGILHSTQPPTGKTSFHDWLTANKDQLGRQYRSELHRHFA